MPTRSPAKEVASARGTVASLSRSRDHQDADLIEARRTLAAANIAAYVERVVDSAPELTPAQRDRIAALLRPVGGGAS